MRILLELEQIAMLECELKKARSRETGGLLFGEHIAGDLFRIVSLSTQEPGSTSHFVRDPKHHANALDQFFEATGKHYERFNYLGEWHSHPNFHPTPSTTDHQTMREILTDPEVGANFLVLLIVRRSWTGLQMSATVYTPNSDPEPARILVEIRPAVPPRRRMI